MLAILRCDVLLSWVTFRLSFAGLVYTGRRHGTNLPLAKCLSSQVSFHPDGRRRVTFDHRVSGARISLVMMLSSSPSFYSFTSSASRSESQLFSQIFGNFNLSPTITAIKFSTFHNLIQKTQFKPRACLLCRKSIKCGVDTVKCMECGLHCHPKCERNLSIMCGGGQKSGAHNYSQMRFRYPNKPPYIPFPILCLINEIELRIESGLHCLPIDSVESSSEVENIVKKFHLKKPQSLAQYNVHILMNCLLRILAELPSHLVRHWNVQGQKLKLEALPKPNRNVLVLLLLHLQNISRQKTSGTSLEALAAIFAPILIEEEVCPVNTIWKQNQTRECKARAQNLLHQLFKLDSEYLLNLLLSN